MRRSVLRPCIVILLSAIFFTSISTPASALLLAATKSNSTGTRSCRTVVYYTSASSTSWYVGSANCYETGTTAANKYINCRVYKMGNSSWNAGETTIYFSASSPTSYEKNKHYIFYPKCVLPKYGSDLGLVQDTYYANGSGLTTYAYMP